MNYSLACERLASLSAMRTRYFRRIFSREHVIFFSRSFATRTRDNLANVASRRVAVSPGGIPSLVIGPTVGERARSCGGLVNFYGENLTSRRGPVDQWTRFAEWISLSFRRARAYANVVPSHPGFGTPGLFIDANLGANRI